MDFSFAYKNQEYIYLNLKSRVRNIEDLPCISHKPLKRVFLEHVDQIPWKTEVYMSIQNNK